MQPVCTQQGEKIALSRRVDKHWRLIGWGQSEGVSKLNAKKSEWNTEQITEICTRLNLICFMSWIRAKQLCAYAP